MEIFNVFLHQNLTLKCLKEFRNIPINHKKVNGKTLISIFITITNGAKT